ncbi:MAG: TATA-box-binding protein [Candidatus Hodarchaeota archaeon]
MDLSFSLKDKDRTLTYTVQNIVVKTSLNLEINVDLNKISAELKNAEYNSERFPGLFVRLRHPKCVIIIFKSGKLILTGLKSFEDINLALTRLILKLNNILEYHIDRNSVEPIIVNIVITANFFKRINLDLAALKLENTIYEPEVFPGLIYRSLNPVKSVFLIFSNGKIVFVGVSEKKDIKPALVNLGRLLSDKKIFMES